jgi:hypothetical protein
MTGSPWLSVLLPTYNGDAFLASALDSIAVQEDPDIECIVVDDGSTDSTLSILESYSSRLPLVVRCPERTGNWVRNTNLALSMARGEYSCFLHQDDLWLGGRLRVLRRLTQRFPEIDLLLNACIFVDPAGRRLGLWRCPLPALPARMERDLILGRLLVQNFIPIPGPIFRTEVAVRAGGMEETSWYTADWDFWLKLAEMGPVGYHATPLAAFRIHGASQTVVRSAEQQDFREQLESVARRHLAIWNPPAATLARIRRLSDFSIEMNTSLAATAHRQRANLWRLWLRFVGLGPVQAHEYLRDSRIWERMYPRLRARLGRAL